jgi:hypothetical protein
MTPMPYQERVSRNHNHMGRCIKGCGRPANNARQVCKPCNTTPCKSCGKLQSASIKNNTGRCRICLEKMKSKLEVWA